MDERGSTGAIGRLLLFTRDELGERLGDRAELGGLPIEPRAVSILDEQDVRGRGAVALSLRSKLR